LLGDAEQPLTIRSHAKIIVAFYDSREAAKLFDKLRNNTVGFAEGTSPMQLHCYQVKREVVEQVSLFSHLTHCSAIDNG